MHGIVVYCVYVRLNLCAFESQFNFDIARLFANPQIHLIAIVENHHIVVSQVVLAEVGAFLRHGEVALLVGAAEQTCVAHVLGVQVMLLATSDANPEEIVRLLVLVDDLNAVRLAVHLLRNVFCDSSLACIRSLAKPHVHDALIVLAVKRHLQYEAELGVEVRSIHCDLNTSQSEWTSVCTQLKQLHWLFLASLATRLLPSSLVNDELLLKVRQELEILLLLVHTHHFQFIAKHGLESLLQAEGEREPAHVAGITTLPEVGNAAIVILHGNLVVVLLNTVTSVSTTAKQTSHNS